MLDDRPARTYTTGPVTKALRLLGIALAAGCAIALLAAYPNMPQSVPTRFDFHGEATEYEAKSSVLWLALIMVLAHSLLAWLSTKPRIVNFPVQLTEHNAQALYREGERLMVWVGLGVSVLFASTALAYFAPTGGLLPLVAGAGLIVVVIIGIIRMVRASGHPAGAAASNHR